MFAWQFLPGLFAPTLTSIALLCLIDNSSKTMRVLGSGYRGFGLFCVSLDWSTISGMGGLYTPASDQSLLDKSTRLRRICQQFWASLNFFGGLMLQSVTWCCAQVIHANIHVRCWVVAPLLYFFNFWNMQAFPDPMNTKSAQSLSQICNRH
jgi:hypothetical protein